MTAVIKTGDKAYIHMSRSSFRGIETLVEAGSELQLNAHCIAVTSPAVELVTSSFPLLAGRPQAEIEQAAREVLRTPIARRESILRRTIIGQWLSEQKFTDWSRLVMEITRLWS